MRNKDESTNLLPKIGVGVLLLIGGIYGASKMFPPSSSAFDAEATADTSAEASAPAGEGTGDEAATAEAVDEAPVAATPAVAAPTGPNDNFVTRSRSANLTGTDTRPAAIVVSTGDSIPYAELVNHVGKMVQITTKLGTVRHGTVLSSNALESHIKLVPQEGGFNLVIAADSVTDVRLVLDVPGA